MTRMNVESFNLDHTKVIAPYVRLVSVTTGKQGDTVHKYDLRFKQPNKAHMDMPGLHSLEHLMAESIRNHSNQVLDLGPMGCQTGFYLMMINHHDYEDLLDILEQTLTDVLAADTVPACNEVQCGFAASHNLTLAKVYAKDMLKNRHQWANVFGPTKEEE